MSKLINLRWLKNIAAVLLCISIMPTYAIAQEVNDGYDDPTYPLDVRRLPTHLRKALRSLNERSLLKVAHAYERGEGVSKDLNLAAKWYLRASEIYLSKEAVKWLEKEEEREEIPAVIYYKGASSRIGGDKTKEAQGVDLIRKAADLGYPDAERTTGLMYFDGEGLPKDLDMAVRYLKRAAIHGEYVESNHVTFGTLGTIYDNDKSSYYNPKLAYYYLLIATRLMPDYYTAEWVKGYDKITPAEKQAINKRAARWKANTPLWEGSPE